MYIMFTYMYVCYTHTCNNNPKKDHKFRRSMGRVAKKGKKSDIDTHTCMKSLKKSLKILRFKKQ